MPASIIPLVLDMMADTVEATPGTLDGYGKFTATPGGPVLSLPCYRSGKIRRVMDTTGREIVSTFKLTVGSTDDLTVQLHRYKYIPVVSESSSQDNLIAIDVKKVNDENGLHHQVIFFP